MKTNFYYVYQLNEMTKVKTLLGYNLSRIECDRIKHSIGKNQCSSCGHHETDDMHLRNISGTHSKMIMSSAIANDCLITMPDAMNNAIKLLNKYGFEVVHKDTVDKNILVESYNQAFEV